MTWWRLNGDVELEALAKAWVAAGFDEKLLPKEPSPAKRLRRAVDKVARAMDENCLVRPLKGQHSWAIVGETASRDDLDYRINLRARLNGEALEVDGLLMHEDQLRAAFEHYRTHLTSNDVSRWLLDTMDDMRAVGLRQGGGIYFVPQGRVDLLRNLAAVLGEVSDHAVYEVPALRSEEAVRAILDALLQEADSELDRMGEEIETGGMGPKALRTRERRCERLLDKVGEYEGLLGRSLDELRDRAEGLKADLVAAAFVAVEDGGDA